ncbi:MAG TPA: ABC-type transport auxiliary lipoprotein family protein [Steroidobacteraceae bacterium]|jgi:cholesterol transport system auxiliary component|nr:ABC-type transport auxiliary lipoprotein family protein [Steroidobacteraceae bacterium]
MRLKLRDARALTASALLVVAGCGGLHSDQPVTQVYTLDPQYAQPKPETAGNPVSVLVLRPQAAPGLDSDRIALRRSAQRLDYYAASRWPAQLPDFLQSLAIDALRASGKYSSVQPDHATFAADEVLQIEIRRFQAEYPGEGAPVVHVQLLATLGHRNDRSVVASVSAESSVPAAENRMQAVVAAFQTAVGAALTDLTAHLPP